MTEALEHAVMPPVSDTDPFAHEILLDPEPLKLLESFSFTRTLYAFDFDGTLSPIVADPSAATTRGNTAPTAGTPMAELGSGPKLVT